RLSEAEEHGRLAVSLGRRVGDEPITGQWQMELATVVLMRGRLDEAVALRDQSATIIAANPEPQAAGTLQLFDGYLALSRRERAGTHTKCSSAPATSSPSATRASSCSRSTTSSPSLADRPSS